MAKKNFLEFLIKKNLVRKDQLLVLKKESKTSDKPIETLILEKGILSEKEFTKAKGEFIGVPFRQMPAGEEIPPSVLEEIPEEAALHYKIIPLNRKNHILEIGMVDPEDFKAREAIKFICLRHKLKSEIYIIASSNFYEVVKKYRTLREEVGTALKELEKELEIEKKEKIRPVRRRKEIERVIEEAPVSKVVAVMLRHAVEGRASDIHIEASGDRVRARFRVDGILYASIFLPLKILPAIVSRIKILSNLRIDETRVPQDGRFHTEIIGKGIDFRVSTFPTAQGEKVAIRILDPTAGVKTLSRLGLSGKSLEIIEKGIEKPFGLIFLSGPTGSGKTTTLYAIMNILNKEQVNIVTLEDPVEYYLDGVNQSQIRPEIGYSFASGLRQVVRQDPDVIMVGEVRDEETASLVTHAALTGHIVLSTLHTNDAVGVIPRLIDLGIQPFLIPASLNLAVAQRLVRKLCPECKEKIRPHPKVERIIREEISKLPEEVKKEIKISAPIYIYKARGCKNCLNKGTKGRIAIFEALSMTSQLEKIILEEPSETKIKEEAKRQGMITMKQDGILKVLEGIVSMEDVLKVVEVTEEQF